MSSFWDRLTKPFFVLAPMADVTDAAFRRIIAKYSRHLRANGTEGAPDVFWTEFVSADGLASTGRTALLRDLAYSEEERPIVAQIFGSKPENIEKAAALARELGFDGVDINMGCPDRSVEKQGAGAAMMKDHALALAVIAAAKQGAGNLPVSVKTRLGFNRDELEEWLPKLLSSGLAAVTVHARTRKDMSKVPARWERVKRAVEIRDALGVPTYILGNGDAKDLADARAKIAATGADGVMLGRAIFGNPWLFHPEIDPVAMPLAERFRVMVEHTKLFRDILGDIKSFAIMKKHYKAYVEGFPGAKELRMELMEAETPEEIEAITLAFLAAREK
ncbi:MAG TPA: tRNA-dihydrouridine synthase [Candidatus Paceibacterota bacterium]|nr:tRNA-dihydrouridine synthase [Candidatus Paceibacterota bacterium]